MDQKLSQHLDQMFYTLNHYKWASEDVTSYADVRYLYNEY